MITIEQLTQKRDALMADYYALQGAIQVLNDLIALAEQEPEAPEERQEPCEK
jgi:hypothetical protein